MMIRASERRSVMSVVLPIAAIFFLVPGLLNSARAQGPFDTRDPLAKALREESVFIGKTVEGRIDADQLKKIVAQEPPNRPLKIAVLSQLPSIARSYQNREVYTRALHDYLGLGQGTLLIVLRNGPAMATDAIPTDKINDILRRNVGALQQDTAQGIQATINDLDATVAAGAPAPRTGDDGSGWLLFPVALVGVGGAVWAIARFNKQRKELQQAKLPVQRLRSEVLESLSWVDSYLDLLPPSDLSAKARDERQKAAAKLQQAADFARTARTATDMARAEALLEQAKQDALLAKGCVDRATGGTGMAVALDGTDYKVTPVLANGTANLRAAPVLQGIHPEDIPANERAACFFCSRPARLTELIPVTIALNGQRRKVLACADDVQSVQMGSAPAVRTVQVNGQVVPWYRAPAYDPYRDYGYVYGYDPYGGYGYGSGLIDGLFLGAILAEPAPFAYPVFVNNDGYATADPMMAAMPDAAPDIQGVGEADFFGVSGADSGGGSDFGNDADFGTDNSGGDFGSSGDSGSWDSGSSDSGGWDSGGSDFGGGDFGGSDSGGGGSDF